MMITLGIGGVTLCLVLVAVVLKRNRLLTGSPKVEGKITVAIHAEDRATPALMKVQNILQSFVKANSRQIRRAKDRRRELKRIRKEHRSWPRERVRDLAIRGIAWE